MTSPTPLRFTVQGQSLTAAELKVAQAGARKPKPACSSRNTSTAAPEAIHKGWRVLGHSPASLAAAERMHRTRGIVFDAQAWRMNNRKTALNARPYALEQAALECAALARKAGWLDVVVEPLTKGAS